MIPVFADTSYYVALLNPNDSAHDVATDLAIGIESPLLTTAWVLAELANALAAMHVRRVFTS